MADWIVCVLLGLYLFKVVADLGTGLAHFRAGRRGDVISVSPAWLFDPLLILGTVWASTQASSLEWLPSWPVLLCAMVGLSIGAYLSWGLLYRLGRKLGDDHRGDG